MWLSRNQLICNQHLGIRPSGGGGTPVHSLSVVKAREDSEPGGWKETLVSRFLKTQASQDHFLALPPPYFLVF